MILQRSVYRLVLTIIIYGWWTLLVKCGLDYPFRHHRFPASAIAYPISYIHPDKFLAM